MSTLILQSCRAGPAVAVSLFANPIVLVRRIEDGRWKIEGRGCDGASILDLPSCILPPNVGRFTQTIAEDPPADAHAATHSVLR